MKLKITKIESLLKQSNNNFFNEIKFTGDSAYKSL